MNKLMFNVISVLTFVFIIMGLSACTPEVMVKTHVVEKTSIRAISIDKDLLQDCKSLSPPDQVVYKSSNRDQREDLLVNYSVALQQSLEKCSIEKRAAREQAKQIEEQVNQYNVAEDQRIKDILEKEKHLE